MEADDPAPREELSLEQLEARPECRWGSFPMRIFFDCESAALSSAEDLSPTALSETMEAIRADGSIRAVRVLGLYSPNQELGREDLALERARVLAEAIHDRTGVLAVPQMFGMAPATTYPEPCVREGSPDERRHVERFATVEVLRCGGGILSGR